MTAASFDWFVEGYRRALARFASTAESREPETRFIPLFETLNWAVAIAEFRRKHGSEIADDTLRALGFARNRVHHQWADALDPLDVPYPPGMVTRAVGHGSRIVAPPTVLDWFWKPLEQLPHAPRGHEDEGGEEAYVAHLAEQPARFALAHLDTLLPPPRER